MILLPAIDMKDGRCVRLKKGDFATVHQVADSALETARAFAAAGAVLSFQHNHRPFEVPVITRLPVFGQKKYAPSAAGGCVIP